jgi:hypothetical protein
MKQIFNVHHLTHKRFFHTVGWSVTLAIVIVITTAALGRAAKNFRAALTDKPDIALYLLLPEEHIGKSSLLKGDDVERSYLAETKDGPKLVKLKRGEKEWFVELIEKLHE